jgi:uncharacterized protein YbjT (DUF2867 family)
MPRKAERSADAMSTVWLAGGSGLVGGELLGLLLADDAFTKVVSVGRRTLPARNPKLVQVKVDFADPKAFEALAAPDIAFSCLGTTIAKAGSPQAFRAVDHDAVLAFANAARSKGAHVFVHVSSLGADPRARGLYASVKGQVERDAAALGFESVYALRPSILDGKREETRPLERVGLAFGRAFGPVLGKYRPTSAVAVARTMVAKAKVEEPGAHVVDAGAIV